MNVVNLFSLKRNAEKNCFILLVLCLVILLNRIFFSFSFLYPERSFKYTRHFNEPYPYNAQQFLEISKNAHEGIGPLIIGTEGNRKIYVMGDYDPGFPILISILGAVGIEFHDIYSFRKINSILLWLGLLCFSLIFIRKKPLVFLTTQILILIYFFTIGAKYSSYYVDYHSMVPSLAILTFSLLEIFFNNKTKWQYGKLFILSIIGGIFGMFRNYFTYVFIFLISFISVNLLKEKKVRLHFALPLLAILILFNFNNLVQRGFYSYARFKNPHLSLSSDIHPPYSHGIWHNAYIGLGFFENKWGIQWDDKVGYEHTKRQNPVVEIYTPKYFSVLRKCTFSI